MLGWAGVGLWESDRHGYVHVTYHCVKRHMAARQVDLLAPTFSDRCVTDDQEQMVSPQRRITKARLSCGVSLQDKKTPRDTIRERRCDWTVHC